MKIVAITDIHARTDYQEHIKSQLQQADLLLIAGDITNFGDRQDAARIVKELAVSNERMYAVPGNCDRPGVSEFLTSNNINLHATVKITGRVMFFGIGGCNKTPFHTPLEYGEKEIADILSKYKKSPEVDQYVLVSHAPPYKTKLDRVLFGIHVGSRAVRNFVEEFQPDIVVCGHIHEARGFDYIGKTLIINTGSFPKHYAIIEINDTITYQLH